MKISAEGKRGQSGCTMHASNKQRHSTAGDQRKPIVLAYHELSSGYVPYLYNVTRSQFEDHLRLITEARDHAGPVSQQVRVSFDDGHVSNHRYALPLLQKYSVPAIFFVIASRIGNQPESMNWQQLRELISLGQEVQSHGWSHQFLTHCSESQLQQELGRSKGILEDKLGIEINALSVPHGRWNTFVLEACAQTGYKHVYISDPWVKKKGNCVNIIGRLMVRNDITLNRLESVLTGRSTALALLKAKYRIKEAFRLIVGDQIYYRLWRRLAGAQCADCRKVACSPEGSES